MGATRKSTAWNWIRKRRDHRWSCPRIQHSVDGDLLPTDEYRLRHHADSCERCGPLLRSLLRLVAALRTLAAPQSPSVAPGVLERLRAEEMPTTDTNGHQS